MFPASRSIYVSVWFEFMPKACDSVAGFGVLWLFHSLIVGYCGKRIIGGNLQITLESGGCLCCVLSLCRVDCNEVIEWDFNGLGSGFKRVINLDLALRSELEVCHQKFFIELIYLK